MKIYRLYGAVLTLLLLFQSPSHALAADLQKNMIEALDSYDTARFLRLLVQSDLAPTNENERILKDGDIEGVLDPSFLSPSDEKKMTVTEKRKTARQKARAKFDEKWEASTNRSSQFEASGVRKKGIQQILSDVDRGSRNDLKPKLEELGLKLVREHPWNASLIVKQIDDMPKGKLLRVFRRAGVEFDDFVLAYESETYSGFWLPTHKTELAVVLLTLGFLGGGLVFGLRYLI